MVTQHIIPLTITSTLIILGNYRVKINIAENEILPSVTDLYADTFAVIILLPILDDDVL